MSADAPTTAELRNLIGCNVQLHGKDWQVIEVLEETPALVLQARSDARVIQADQHGEAHRRVAPTETIPVYQSGSLTFHPLFRAAGLADALQQAD